MGCRGGRWWITVAAGMLLFFNGGWSAIGRPGVQPEQTQRSGAAEENDQVILVAQGDPSEDLETQAGDGLEAQASVHRQRSRASPIIMQRGSQGPQVEHLQIILTGLGHLSKADQVSGPGQYGPKTEAAVLEFRQENGLGDSGSLDNRTWEILKALDAGLSRGSGGPVVVYVQDLLVQMGLMTEEQVASGPGNFGPLTERAIEVFQLSRQLQTGGLLDIDTYRMLRTTALGL